MLERLLSAFNHWFASAAGVLQTLVLVLALVILEAAFPHIDNNGFHLLYWLTVYSAVTQPALAYIALRSGDSQEKAEARQEAILNHLETILEHVKDDPGERS